MRGCIPTPSTAARGKRDQLQKLNLMGFPQPAFRKPARFSPSRANSPRLLPPSSGHEARSDLGGARPPHQTISKQTSLTVPVVLKVGGAIAENEREGGRHSGP